MEADTFRQYCLAKAGVIEDTPFGEDHLVFKVGGKMFALLSLDEIPSQANLKCDPDRAMELRDRYEGVKPGYHMNKKHWNSVVLGGDVPDQELRMLIDHSYQLVVQALPRHDRERLALRASPDATPPATRSDRVRALKRRVPRSGKRPASR